MKNFRSYSLGAAVLAASLLICVGSAGYAQTAGAPAPVINTPPVTVAGAAPKAEHGGTMKMLKLLGLTPAQKAELKPIIKSQRSQLEAIKNDTALTDLQRKQQMRQVRESTLTQVRADLTPAQLQTLDTYLAQQKADRKAAKAADQP